MTAQQDAAELLAAHTVRGVKDGLWHCECGMYWPLEGDSVEPYMRHLARVLDGAGLLVTPERDAQVAARALREVAEVIDSDSFEVIGAPAEFHQGMQSAVDRLRRRADRIERQEEGE